jgi:hypothetical protein
MYQSTYDSLIDEGVDPGTARWAAGTSAALGTALFSGLPGAVGFKGKAANEVPLTMARVLARWAGRTAHGTGLMTAQGTQEAAIEEIAKTIAGKSPGGVKAAQNILHKAWTGIELAGPMAVLAGPRALAEIVGNRMDAGGKGPSRPEAKTLGIPSDQIDKLLDRTKWFEKNRDRLQQPPVVPAEPQARVEGEPNAQQVAKTSSPDGGGGPQPELRQEGGRAAEGGEGVQPGGRGDRDIEREAAPPEKVVGQYPDRAAVAGVDKGDVAATEAWEKASPADRQKLVGEDLAHIRWLRYDRLTPEQRSKVRDTLGIEPSKPVAKGPFREPLLSEKGPFREPLLSEEAGVKEVPSDVTGIANAVVNLKRGERGLEPIERSPLPTEEKFGGPPGSWQQWLDLATERRAKDSTWTDRLVEELRASPRPHDEIEAAGLELHNRDLNNSFNAASDRLFAARKADDPAETVKAQTDVDAVMERMQHADEATYLSGRKAGQAFGARKMLLLEDYTLAPTVRRIMVAKGGEPLTSKEHEKVTKEVEAITKAEKEREATATEAAGKRIDQATAAIQKTLTPKSKRPPSAKRVVAEKNIAAAWANFFDVIRTAPSAGIPIKAIEAAVGVVKAYIDFGVVRFTEFMKEARDRVGEEAEKSRPVFAAAWKQLGESGELPERDVDVADLQSVRKLAKQLHREVVELGITDRKKAVDAVHEELGQYVPDITRRQTEDAMSGYGDYRQLTKDEISVKVREHKGELQQLGKLEDMQKGVPPAKTGVERRVPSGKERQLIAQVNEAKKRGGFTVTDPATQLKSSLDAAKTAIRNRMADKAEEIRTRQKIVNERTPLAPDAELTKLRKDYDALNEVWQQVFPKQPMTKAQRIAAAESGLDRAITQLETDIKTGDIGPKGKRILLSSPQLEVKRLRLAELRTLRDEMRELANPKMTPEERSNLAYKRSLEKRLADYQERVANKDFAKKPVTKRVPDKEDVDKLHEIEQHKDTLRAMEEKARRASRTLLRKVLDVVPETLNVSRSILTSMDVSAVARQGGWLSAGHPILAAKAQGRMFKSFASEKALFAVNDEIASRVNAKNGLYKQGEVELTEINRGLYAMEEAYRGHWSKSIPLVAGSERAYVAFLNIQRADVFDSMVRDLGNFITPAEVKIIGNYVNVASGRGSVGQYRQAAGSLATVLFAPRFLLSRFQLLLVQPLWTRAGEGSWRVRKLVAKEYGRSLTGLGVFYGTAALALGAMMGLPSSQNDNTGWSITFNPFSPDFGKIRIGTTRIDPLVGLSQTTRFTTRMSANAINGIRAMLGARVGKAERTEMAKTPYTILRFGQGKVSPWFGSALDIGTGKNFENQPVTPTNVAIRMVVPISFGDIYEAMKAQGVPAGTAIGLLAIFGMGVQNYKPKRKLAKGPLHARQPP